MLHVHCATHQPLTANNVKIHQESHIITLTTNAWLHAQMVIGDTTKATLASPANPNALAVSEIQLNSVIRVQQLMTLSFTYSWIQLTVWNSAHMVNMKMRYPTDAINAI